jgi:hypothetical protein
MMILSGRSLALLLFSVVGDLATPVSLKVYGNQNLVFS